ncbi:hypothetical protein GH733_001174 [Mirounga leonina]|nr:hypothetical protein GH733_001174 [Mirounga leonina]
MHSIFDNQEKESTKLEQIATITNKAPGQGIPNSANTQGNSTPNPRVRGYPLNYVVIPNNLSEENNGMMLSDVWYLGDMTLLLSHLKTTGSLKLLGLLYKDLGSHGPIPQRSPMSRKNI